MLETGIQGRAETLVSKENTAASMGSGNLEVFATPCMVALMEEASQCSVAPFLGEGESTVGTKLCVSHDSTLTEIDGRRLVFEVRAFDACGPIGQGTHERFIILRQRFLEKVEAKKA